MKKFVLILGVCFVFSANARAEDFQTVITEENNETYPDKTVADVMIERFYNHPEDIAEVDAECAEVMKWVDSTLNYGTEKYYHEATLCLTWEINKKLDKEKIELLAKIKSTLHNIILDLVNDEHIGVLQTMYIDYECQLMLVKKIYNIIYSSSIPLCFDNSAFSTPDRPSSVCNKQSSSYLSGCLKNKDAKTCMDKMIIDKFLTNSKQKSLIEADVYQLNNLTDKFIESL
ncbi:hypothetical protein IJ556_03945, partial [bacterium]|nr:hypothetical protein [bacterium]